MKSQIVSQNLSQKEKTELYAEFLAEETIRRLLRLENLEAVILAAAYNIDFYTLRELYRYWLESLEKAEEQEED